MLRARAHHELPEESSYAESVRKKIVSICQISTGPAVILSFFVLLRRPPPFPSLAEEGDAYHGEVIWMACHYASTWRFMALSFLYGPSDLERVAFLDPSCLDRPLARPCIQSFSIVTMLQSRSYEAMAWEIRRRYVSSLAAPTFSPQATVHFS